MVFARDGGGGVVGGGGGKVVNGLRIIVVAIVDGVVFGDTNLTIKMIDY
jgi:hypothetical protein